MTRSTFSSLILLIAGLVSPLRGLETFRPEPVTWGTAPDGNFVTGALVSFVLGDTWVAYRDSNDVVRVADRFTGQVLQSFEKPAADMPVEGVPGQWRTVGGGGQILMHGNKLAIVSSASIRNSPPGFSGTTRNTIHASFWDLPSGSPAGVVDIELSEYNPFCALSETRLVVLDEQQRRFLQWDAATLAPLPTITVPAEFPAPRRSSSYGSRPIAMGGDTVVFRKDGYAEPLDLVAVNLATGGIARLPLPTDRVLTGRVAMGARNDGLLVASVSLSNTSATAAKLDLLHYDLTTGTLVGDTTLDNSPSFVNDVRVLVQPDGGWRVLTGSGGYSGFHLVSGHDLKSTYDAHVEIPSSLWLASHEVLAADSSEIWFKPPQSSIPGTRAVKLSAGVAASTIISATALPCAESDGVLQVKLTCSPAPTSPLGVRIRTKDGTATAAGDFTAVDRLETVPAGQTEAIISIPITQDTVIEPTEHFLVEFLDASPAAVLPMKEVAATIRATSLDLLSPVATYDPGPAAKPHRVYLANGTLLQFNQRTDTSSAPKLARGSFDGGEWLPSPNWGRVPVSGQSAEFHGRSGNLALLREDGDWSQQPEYTLYDVPNDQVLFRVKPTGIHPPRQAAMGPSRFFFAPGSYAPDREYDLTAPHAPRAIAREPDSGTPLGVAYTRDFLAILSGTRIEKYSLVDGSYQGLLLPSGPWSQTPTMAAEDDLLAIRSNGDLWVLSIDHPEQVRKVEPPAGGFGSNGTILEFADGLLYSAIPNIPLVHLIDPRNGVLLESVSQDFQATVPEGWAGPEDYASFYMQSFSTEGKKAALLAFEGDNYNNTQRVVRLSREGKLPSLRNPVPILESDGSLDLKLAEAAPFPITVTTRTVTTVHNQQEDWSGTGSTVIPAGQATFATELSVVDDHISEGDRNVALEITLTGNGHTEVRRLPIRVLDNDRIALADVPHEEVIFDSVFAATGGAWAVRSGTDSFAWTGDPGFLATTPNGWEAAYSFPWNMAGSGNWLAVAHDTWGGNFGIKYPSSVFLYQPASGNLPVRNLKGMKSDNNFGQALLVRGNKLWVGAPGRYDTNGNKKIDVKGQAFKYDMTSGKRVRAFKPQKAQARGFGYRIAANDSSVWFSSYDRPSLASAVSQYSRATGKWVRTLAGSVGSGEVFGGQLEATPDTLVATAAGQVRGHSATTGTLSWTIAPPADHYFGAIELIRNDLLVVAGTTLFFYRITPGAAPVMLVEVTGYGLPVTQMETNGNELLVYRQDYSSTDRWTLIDLPAIPQLSEHFPFAATTPAAARAIAAAGTEPVPSLVLATVPAGWQLTLPAAPDASVLEFSTDLARWNTLFLRENAAWQKAPDVELAGVNLISTDAVEIPLDQPRLFFRIRTP